MDTGRADHHLNTGSAPAWQRWTLFAALFALGLAYVAAFAFFLDRSEDFIARRMRVDGHAQALAQPLLPGQSLNFCSGCNGVGHLGAGWFRPEREGVWSASAQAELYLAVPATVPTTIELEFSALVDPGIGHNTVVLSTADGIELGRWQVALPAGPKTRSQAQTQRVTLPITRNDEPLTLLLSADVSRNEILARIGQDQRRLGVRLIRLSVAEPLADDATR